MAKISELTNMMLGEIAPHIDEILAYMFAEIDNDPTLTLAEKKEEKKKGMSALTKGIVGGGGIVGTTAAVAKRGDIGAAMTGAGEKMVDKAVKMKKGFLREAIGRGGGGMVDAGNALIKTVGRR